MSRRKLVLQTAALHIADPQRCRRCTGAACCASTCLQSTIDLLGQGCSKTAKRCAATIQHQLRKGIQRSSYMVKFGEGAGGRYGSLQQPCRLDLEELGPQKRHVPLACLPAQQFPPGWQQLRLHSIGHLGLSRAEGEGPCSGVGDPAVGRQLAVRVDQDDAPISHLQAGHSDVVPAGQG